MKASLEELLSAIIDKDLDGIIYYEAVRDERNQIIDFAYKFLNEPCCTILKRPRENFLNHTFNELNRDYNSGVFFEVYKKIVETGENVQGDFFNEPAQIWVSYNFSKFDDGVIAFFRDITERKNMENDLRRSLQEKEIVMKESEHRQKNNLHLIQNILFLKCERTENKEAKAAINDVINHLNVISLIQNKLFVIENIEQVDLPSYIKDLVDTIADLSSAKYRRIVVKTDLDPLKCSSKFAINIGLFINELMTNALKYAFPHNRAGLIEVSIKIRNGMVFIYVDDDGIGVNREQMEKKNSLGTQLIYSLAEQLNGKLTIENRQGTKVSLIITQELF